MVDILPPGATRVPPRSHAQGGFRGLQRGTVAGWRANPHGEPPVRSEI